MRFMKNGRYLEIGQEVKIKSLEEIYRFKEESPTIVPEMHKYCGQVGTIDHIIFHDKDVNYYILFGWTWREDWLEIDIKSYGFLKDEDFEI